MAVAAVEAVGGRAVGKLTTPWPPVGTSHSSGFGVRFVQALATTGGVRRCSGYRTLDSFTSAHINDRCHVYTRHERGCACEVSCCTATRPAARQRVQQQHSSSTCRNSAFNQLLKVISAAGRARLLSASLPLTPAESLGASRPTTCAPTGGRALDQWGLHVGAATGDEH